MVARAIHRRDDDACLWPTRTLSLSGAFVRVYCRFVMHAKRFEPPT
jgi:hypothetical protein